ncbi:MAG: ATP-binding protein [Acidobacteriota bacterium]
MGKSKEIVVLSGKGGTGKTTVTSSLARLIPSKIIADTDVDAANMYILMDPRNYNKEKFKGKSVAEIDDNKCISCNICKEKCRFNAIEIINGKYKVDNLSCDGCTLCSLVCPANAIEMKRQFVGEWYLSDTKYGDFVYARLDPGAENSGNLVTMVKHQSKLKAEEKNIDLILIDGPPGIGCPVTASLSGADFAIIVTEPSLSGISDLKRILHLAEHFKVKTGIVINKFDINENNCKSIESFASKTGIEIMAKIPHSYCVINEISNRNIPFDNCEDLSEPVKEIYGKIVEFFKESDVTE